MAGPPAPLPKSARCGTNRIPWRALGLGSSGIGGIAAAYYTHPLVGLVIAICETTVATTIIATALFGSATTSDRAFRFLRWLADRPEPDGPAARIHRTTRRQGKLPLSRRHGHSPTSTDGSAASTRAPLTSVAIPTVNGPLAVQTRCARTIAKVAAPPGSCPAVEPDGDET